MFTSLVTACKSFLNRIKNQLKKITKPSTVTIAAGALSDLPRSKSDLIAENAILRQQLIVLSRQVKRPQLITGDRIRLVLMARLTRFWQTTLHIIQPDTLLRWHRDLFRLYWKRKSKPKKRKPRIPQETIDLIKQMAQENPFWGAEKIRGERLKGELLKLGISVGKPTIQKYML